MFVLIKSRTYLVGCDSDDVYEVSDDLSENDLEEIANELAMYNAEMYGIDEDSNDGDEPYWGTYEILDMSREEIKEQYGEITVF